MTIPRQLRIGAFFLGAFAISVGGLVAFGGFRSERTAASYKYVAPRAKSDGIAVANAATLGVDTNRMRELVRPFLEKKRGTTTSLLVMKDGRLIIEEYFAGWKADRRHTVQSISKSITSLLVGYGLGQHYIASIDDPIAKYLPNYRHLLTGGKEKITIRHLLTMTAGLDWDEGTLPYSDSLNMRVQHLNSADGTAFTLSRPLIAQPGETWNYNGGGVTILTEILENASGLSSRQLVERAFAGFLDRGEIEPTFEKDGRMNSSGGFQVTPRGMAKIGQMLLQHGEWNGKQVFDRDWIKESTDAVVGRGRSGYNYLWWRQAFRLEGRLVEAMAANGYGGQRIWAFPDLNLVIVVTAANYENPTPADTLVERDVFPALGPFHLTTGRVIATSIDSASAFPPRRVSWSPIGRDSIETTGVFRTWVDTVAHRKLDDGSYLVWWRSETSKPRMDNGRPYDRAISRFVFRCETPTDARYKRVSTTGFLGNGPIVFQDDVGLPTALAQPWVPAGGLDMRAFQRACEKFSSLRSGQARPTVH